MPHRTLHIGCPGCDDGTHYVEVAYDLHEPNRYVEGEWQGRDDCACSLTPALQGAVVNEAEQRVLLDQ